MAGNIDRRTFLRSAYAGIAGSSLLLNDQKLSLMQNIEPLGRTGYQPDDDRYWGLVKEQYLLEKGLTYFNNGSLGPSPCIVYEATNEFRRKLDSYPSKYMWGEWAEDKEYVRAKAARLLNASKDEIALTHNTTEGLNLVARSLQLDSGDEVIMADHEHHTGVLPFVRFQESRGVRLVRPILPILPESPGDIIDVYTKVLTSRTKAILICHIINTNGMILPIREICEIASKRGIRVLVDGAQVPGMLQVDVKEIGCDFYAASGHKWLQAPKGTGVFYVREKLIDTLTPLIVSGGYYKDTTARQFENYNTRNLPEVLGLGTAIDYHNLIGGGAVQARIYELKNYLRNAVEQEPFLALKSPAPDTLSAGITSVEVKDMDVRTVANRLEAEYRIVCRPIWAFGINGLRVSTSIFNNKKEIDRFIEALREIRKSN